jgi:carbon monoxide dehydrogenase subunit G
VTVVSGARRFAAPRERVFELLTDPGVIASAIPAVRGHQVLDRDHWEAKVKLPVPLAPKVTVHFEVLERRPAEHAALHAHGAGADVMSRFDLVEQDGGTLMHWEARFGLSGHLDRIVGHGLEPLAHRQATRTLDAVERALEG